MLCRARSVAHRGSLEEVVAASEGLTISFER
jgi:hypothetical protein